MPPCCYLGCPSELEVHLHVFPNPKLFPEQFKKWVEIVGGQLNTPDDYTFFRSKRLCDRHFTEKDRNRNNRLNALAIPSLFLQCESEVHTLTTVSETQTEIAMDTPLFHATVLTDLKSSMKDNSTTEAETLKTQTSLAIDVPLLQTSSLIEVCDEKESASISTLDPEDSIACSSTALEELLNSTANTTCISTIDDISPLPTATVSNRAFTGSDTSTFLEHNYSKPLFPKSHNMAALEMFNKKPVFSLNKYRSEQRQIRNLKVQINTLRKKCTTFKSRLACASKMSMNLAFQKVTKNMTPSAKLFTHMQSSQSHKRPSGRRFTLEEKILSLSLYKRSPKCYSTLAHEFILPSKKTLKVILAKIKLGPGLNEKVFEKLHKTVQEMGIEDRLCTLIFDEMSLTPQINYDMANDRLKGFVSIGKENHIANHVLVFMVKGIKANFKQPVAYYFTNSLTKFDLKNIIEEVIKKIQATGLIVLCSVCDQSTINVGAISLLVQISKNKMLKQGKEWRHDFYEINNKKIIPLYDVPHLLKGLRNNLLTKDMMYVDIDDGNKEKKLKWKHFQEIYEADKTFGELRLLNKITEEHINIDKIKKMRVNTAAQIFSHSVAVVAEHLTARGMLNEECRNLIPFVLIIDKLFDSLNSNTFHIPNGKIYKGCVRKSSPHHRLWIKAKQLLKSVKFIAKKKNGDKVRLVTTTVPSTNNFVKTIEGFEALWNILIKKYRFDCMLTRHFNQDPVENFFGNIRSYGARNNSPNVVAFEGAFKALLLNNYNSPHAINANCEKDENKCLQTFDFFLKENSEINVEDIPEEIEINEEMLTEKVIQPDMGQRNYVCGWVLSKCLKNIVKGCVTCKSELICKEENKNNEYIKNKEYNKIKKWLTYPSNAVVSYFYEIQENTVATLKKNVPKKNLKSKILWMTKTLNSFPCNCPIHKEELTEYFIKTTINILINSWCRDINRILSGKVTYEGDDEIKVAAKLYYEKHKHWLKNK